MNKIRLFCTVLVLSLTVASVAFAQGYYTIDSYEVSEEPPKPDGFRLDVGGGMSLLMSKFENPRIKLNRVGPQLNINPAYVFSTGNQSLGVDVIWKKHTYEEPSFIRDKVDLDIIYVGPKYTWEATPYKKGSLFIDFAIYYGRVNECGRKNTIDNNFETWGIAGAVGYNLRLSKWAKMFVKASFMYSSYEVAGGIYAGRNLSGVGLTTGFWLFK